MIGLTTKELDAIRSDINGLLPDTGYILSVTTTADGAGGNTESVGTAGTTTYRLDPKLLTGWSSEEKVSSAELRPFHTFILTLPYNATINTNNRFKDKNGVIYNIASIDENKSWQASIRCVVEKT